MSTRVIKYSGCSVRRIIYIFTRATHPGKKTKFWLRSLWHTAATRPAGITQREMIDVSFHETRLLLTHSPSFSFVYGADHHFLTPHESRRAVRLAQILIIRVARCIPGKLSGRSLCTDFLSLACSGAFYSIRSVIEPWNEFSSIGEPSRQLRFTVSRKRHSESRWSYWMRLSTFITRVTAHFANWVGVELYLSSHVMFI